MQWQNMVCLPFPLHAAFHQDEGGRNGPSKILMLLTREEFFILSVPLQVSKQIFQATRSESFLCVTSVYSTAETSQQRTAEQQQCEGRGDRFCFTGRFYILAF